jgi:alpha-tubulin suppressor-like RCC1 family protein
MKQNKMQYLTQYLLFPLLTLLLGFSASAQVGIGTDDPKGILDVNSSTMGIVLPKVAYVDSLKTPNPITDSITGITDSSAALGTLVYDITKHCARVKASTGWTNCLLDSVGVTEALHNILSLGANFKVVKAAISTNWAVLLGKDDHAVYFSGTNANGVSGLGRAGGYVRSYTLIFTEPIRDIGAGTDHVIAADSLGRVWTWGSNGNYRTGQQGASGAYINGSYTALPDSCDFFGPVKGAGKLARLVAAGATTSYVVTENGDLYGIGSGAASGTGSALTSWTKLSISEKVVQISASQNNTAAAVTETGKLYVWGSNGNNSNGTGGTRNTPYLSTTPLVRKAVMGMNGGAAISQDSTKIFAWGESNVFANSADVASPQDITNKIPGFNAAAGDRILDVAMSRVSTGTNGNITVVTSKGVYTSGQNSNGQLGLGSTTTATAANSGQQLRAISTLGIPSDTKFIGVAAGRYDTILLTEENPTHQNFSYVAYGAGRGRQTNNSAAVLGVLSGNILVYKPLTK